jgi:hypothetical protein
MQISDDWTFVAMVLDRLFLLIFSILNMGTFSIIISAPTLFDFRQPLNETVPSGEQRILGEGICTDLDFSTTPGPGQLIQRPS